MPRLSVIIPAHDAEATLSRTLARLADQDVDESYEVIVVDNGSTDGTAAIAERSSGPVTVLRQRNLGPAAGRNRGVAAATGEILAFTDADCFPEPDWLAVGAAAAQEHDLVQGRVRPDPQVEMRAFDRSLWVDSETALYQTANLFVRREAFEAVGGFEGLVDAWANRPFGEDVLFGWRVRRAGGRVAFCRRALVYHAVFRRRASDFIAERWRRRFFPALTGRIPELRRELFFARLFLDRRTAAFDAAVAGSCAAGVLRSPAPLVAAVPYLAMLARDQRRHGRYEPRVAAVHAAADAVSLAALLQGSLRSRTPLL